MTLDTLRLVRNILLRTFAVAFIIVLILASLTFALWDTWMGMATSWFHIDASTITPMVMQFFIDARFYLLFVILAPALAMHWTLKCENKQPR